MDPSSPIRRKRRDTSPNPSYEFAQHIYETAAASNQHTRSGRSRRALIPTCTAFPVVSTNLAGPYSTFATLKNLKKYARYQITVRVYNSYSDGPKSWPPFSFTTPQDGKNWFAFRFISYIDVLNGLSIYIDKVLTQRRFNVYNVITTSYER